MTMDSSDLHLCLDQRRDYSVNDDHSTAMLIARTRRFKTRRLPHLGLDGISRLMFVR